jgi:hypothetical protein
MNWVLSAILKAKETKKCHHRALADAVEFGPIVTNESTFMYV